jgi:hypothetical protein
MLRNPDTAVWLYAILVVVGFAMGKRWQPVRDAIAKAGSAAQTKTAAPGG